MLGWHMFKEREKKKKNGYLTLYSVSLWTQTGLATEQIEGTRTFKIFGDDESFVSYSLTEQPRLTTKVHGAALIHGEDLHIKARLASHRWGTL